MATLTDRLDYVIGAKSAGPLEEHFGIRTAFALGVPLVVLSLITAGALDSRAAKTRAA